MEEDTDLPPERETKDFQFRQLKKIRIFDSSEDLPKDRSNLLTISNKYGLLFAASPMGLKIYYTKDILVANKPGEDVNKIALGPQGIHVPMNCPIHHLALSADNLTLSVCLTSSEQGTSVMFYDVRTLINEAKPQKTEFASYKLLRDGGGSVIDLKWNPAVPSMVSVCLSDGSISVLQVTDTVSVFANLPAALGVTSVCWSPKGKQLAVGKQNGTVVQYLPSLQEKKVIPCPSFYDSENPVKVLDVLWVSTYVFAVVYAAADGSLEASPQLVIVILPKKEDKRSERFLNFTETCFSICSERQHHFFLNFIEDWEILLAASAASIDVSVIAHSPDQGGWEQWLLEDTSRAETPMKENNDDTLPMGVVIDYTSQMEVFISESQILPPVPVLLLLSTDGVLCPFHMVNLNPAVKPLITVAEPLSLEGERQIKSVGAAGFPPASVSIPSGPPAVQAAPPHSFSFGPSAISSVSPAPLAPAQPTSTPPTTINTTAPPTTIFQPAGPSVSISQPAAPPAFGFSSPNAAAKTTGPSSFQFTAASANSIKFASPATVTFQPSQAAAPPPTTSQPAAPPSFSFSVTNTAAGKSAPISMSPAFGLAGSGKFTPPSAMPFQPFGAVTQTSSVAAEASSTPAFTPLPSAVKVNLKDKFSASETTPSGATPSSIPASFSFAPSSKPSAAGPTQTQSLPFQTPSRSFAAEVTKGTAIASHSSAQKTTKVSTPAAKISTPQTQGNLESIGQPKAAKDSDLILNGIREEISHFQKEMNDLKERTDRASFLVGSQEELKRLRTESDCLDSFLQEIKETTESLRGEISIMKTNNLEGFASIDDAKQQIKLKQDPTYRQLLYKKPLDPKSEAQMQEIRRLHQYVESAVQDVSDVLDVEWDRYVEERRKQKGPIVPERESLFSTLANNQQIINQQRPRLNQLMENLQRLRLYNQTSQWDMPHEDSSIKSFEEELENMRNALSQTTMDTKIEQHPKLPPKLSPVKQNQLRNFLTKRKLPPIRCLAPANLNRSSFLAPDCLEDLDDASSSSSLSEAAELENRNPPAQVVKRQEAPPIEKTSIKTAKHAPVGRTASVQPNLAASSVPFGKPDPGLRPATSTPVTAAQPIRVIPQGADSTMLATKTVKHFAPNVTAAQKAAMAAIRRQTVSQPIATSLTESTLQTVPQVVNVKELKNNGPGPSIPMVIGPTVPHSAAQAIHQVLATVSSVPARQGPLAGPLKNQPAPGLSSSLPVQAIQGTSISKVTALGQKSESTVTLPPTSSAAAAPIDKPISSSGFAFTNVTSSSVTTAEPGSTTTGSVASVIDPNHSSSFVFGNANKSLFSSGPEGSFSFTSLKPTSSSSSTSTVESVQSKPTVTTTPASVAVNPPVPTSSKPEIPPGKPGEGLFQGFSGGETLGSFSGLRVAQLEEAAKVEASKPPPPVQPAKMPSSTPLFSFGTAEQESKSGDASSTPSSTAGSLFGSLQLTNTGSATSTFTQGANKPAFNIGTPQSTAQPVGSSSATQPSGSVSFSSLLVSTASLSTTATTIPAAPSTSILEVKQPVKPLASEPSGPPQPLTPNSQAVACAIEPVSSTVTTAPLAPAVSTVTDAAISNAKVDLAPIPSQPALDRSGQNVPVTSTVMTAPVPVPVTSTPAGFPTQVPALGTATVPPASESLPLASLPGQTSAATSAFAQSTITAASTPQTAPGFGQAIPGAPSLFAQPCGSSASTSANTGTAFGTSVFGVAGGTGGFAQPSFGQTASLWKGTATTQSNFAFSQTGFGSQSAFGQPPASTATSSSGGLFGSPASSSSASSFSFGQPSSTSGTSTPGGLFGQSSSMAFGQSSTFPQSAPVFGSSGSTTTTTTSGFSFGQPGFNSSSSGSLFGQAQNTGTSVFGQQPSSTGGSVFGAGSSGGSSGGFFSGLGGKPSQEAANKNPFGTTGSATFGTPSTSNASSLFGNSGAKSFGFGTTSFGEKPSGTFSAGGSVASQGFGFPSPTKTGGFGAAPVFGSPPTFGGSPGFGGAPAFGTAPPFSSPLGSTGGKVFGEGTSAANTGGFGFGTNSGGATFGNIANQSTPTFGSLTQQGTGFGSQSTGFSGFGSGSGGGAPSSGGFGFGVSSTQASPGFGGWRS